MHLLELPKDWVKPLSSIIEVQKTLTDLNGYLNSEIAKGKVVYPPLGKCFQAFELVRPQEVKVVILGQDPYHGAGEAHGLAFSVGDGVQIPPSLRNIFKELNNDLGFEIPKSGDLTPWANEGVLLLNSSLTVVENQPGSHFGKGWEELTDAVIKVASNDPDPKVFVLWGAKAQLKKSLINSSYHMVIESPHPSPLSSYRGFFGSKPFSRANEFLKNKNRQSVSWKLS